MGANVDQCVILAGGLGTRMKPLTENIPKALIPVAGQPFLAHQLSWMAQCGITRVLLCVAHKGEMIREFVSSRTWPMQIEFSVEGPSLLGTAGALRCALDRHLLDNTFLVTYGDSYLPVHFAQIGRRFLASQAKALMTVFRNENRWDASNVVFDGNKVLRYEKIEAALRPKDMLYIDYGLCAFQRSVIETLVPAQVRTDLTSILRCLSIRGELVGVEVGQRFYEIGSPAGLQDMEDFLNKPQTA